MTWSISLANVQLADVKSKGADGTDLVETFGDRVAALAAQEFQKGKPSGPTAKPTAAQVALVAKLVNDSAQALLATHPTGHDAPARPTRAAVRLYGEANWDGSTVGTHLGLEVRLDDVAAVRAA
jgi:hypothetical protein